MQNGLSKKFSIFNIHTPKQLASKKSTLTYATGYVIYVISCRSYVTTKRRVLINFAGYLFLQIFQSNEI